MLFQKTSYPRQPHVQTPSSYRPQTNNSLHPATFMIDKYMYTYDTNCYKEK